MDPAIKESVLADLRLANAFFDAASRIAGATLLKQNAGTLKRDAIQMGHQLLQIAMDRMKGSQV